MVDDDSDIQTFFLPFKKMNDNFDSGNTIIMNPFFATKNSKWNLPICCFLYSVYAFVHQTLAFSDNNDDDKKKLDKFKQKGN